MLAHLKSSPGPATLATTVQRGERVADADVPVRYHEEFISIILIILMFLTYQEEFIFSSCYVVVRCIAYFEFVLYFIVLNCLV